MVYTDRVPKTSEELCQFTPPEDLAQDSHIFASPTPETFLLTAKACDYKEVLEQEERLVYLCSPQQLFKRNGGSKRITQILKFTET